MLDCIGGYERLFKGIISNGNKSCRKPSRGNEGNKVGHELL